MGGQMGLAHRNQRGRLSAHQILILVNLIPSLCLYILAIAMACVYGTKYPEYETCRLLNS